ncbi:DUF1430 domain-containing protein [Priestia koreensis]|uniref:DUF1430 domain-containing protein n=1 Tax=Priestia koreensis TaxID=284581 RepID=UPI00204052E4|nr:DUF1430 domain-containing protein [Priestia koreensis]MCM3006846.1 DUF1430 domain-containing protein [Priestia koreensis]
MKDDVMAAALHHKVDFFTFNKYPSNTLETNYKIYGTTGAKSYIQKKFDITNKQYSSLFLGKVNMSFHDFKNIKGIESYTNYYIIGDRKDIHNFKMDLIDKYAGNHPIKGTNGNEIRNTLICVWMLIISVILLISYYGILIQKKENLIRVSLGESIRNIALKNIFIDTIAYTMAFILSFLLLHSLTNVFFYFSLSIIGFITLLILNSVLYISFYFYNLRETFSNSRGSKKLLTINYGMKIVSSIITISIISSNLVLIFDSYQLYTQKPFFQKHADYNYVKLEYRINENSNRFQESLDIQSKFYHDFYDKFSPIMLGSGAVKFSPRIMLLNTHALDYIGEEIKEVKTLKRDRDFYFIIPENSSSNAKQLEWIPEQLFGSYPKGATSQTVVYKGSPRFIGIDELSPYTSEWVKKPIFVVYNVHNRIPKFNSKIFQEIMYKTSDKEFDQFIENNHLKGQMVSKTNVLDHYEGKWLVAKRLLYLNVVFSILILALEFIIISSIIKMEYHHNSIELAVKKTLGYGSFEKNKKIILITFITSILSTGVAIGVSSFLTLGKEIPLAIGGIILFLLEVLVIVYYSNKVEKSNIQKILKGGNV